MPKCPNGIKCSQGHHHLTSTLEKSAWQTLTGGELRQFYLELNLDDYDAVVDMQNNLKSALVSKLRRGPVYGLDKESCRERPAHLAYQYPQQSIRSNMPLTECVKSCRRRWTIHSQNSRQIRGKFQSVSVA